MLRAPAIAGRGLIVNVARKMSVSGAAIGAGAGAWAASDARRSGNNTRIMSAHCCMITPREGRLTAARARHRRSVRAVRLESIERALEEPALGLGAVALERRSQVLRGLDGVAALARQLGAR